MKITRLQAEQVHGYLPIDVEFFDDITFLTGLNGSGKTSSLRLLMALLTPNLEELGAIAFSSAAVTIRDGSDNIVVSAEKMSGGVTLAISSAPGNMYIGSSDLEVYAEVRRRDEPRSFLIERYEQSQVFQDIRKLSTPMFLGLDRRFYAPGKGTADISDVRRSEQFARRLLPDDPSLRGATSAALVEVNYLVVTRVQEVRASQEQLDERLRTQFFTKAFEYKPSDLTGGPANLPSRSEIDSYRKQLAKMERAAEGIRIPLPEIQSALTLFFERLSAVVESLDRHTKLQAAAAKTAKRPGAQAAPQLAPVLPSKDFVEWIINKPQADRILEHLGLLDDYIERRNRLRDPITRFLTLVNGFLEQTHKAVNVAPNGTLSVAIRGREEPRPISSLSSGERQLLVMLAHLSLNPSLADSGVFIVDEPELSLHLDWQEKFVDAIREANPRVQFILATHSPAIILDREESCRSLDEVRNA